MVRCEVALQNVVLTQHVLNTLFALLDFNLLLGDCEFLVLLILDKTFMMHLLLVIVLLWFWVGLVLVQTSVLRVTHVPVWRRFWDRSDYDSLRFSLFAFLHIRGLNRKISRLLALSFVLSTCWVYFSNDVFVRFQVLLSFFTVFLLILTNCHVKHSVLNI